VRGRQERALARKQAKLRARGENAKEAVKSESKDSK